MRQVSLVVGVLARLLLAAPGPARAACAADPDARSFRRMIMSGDTDDPEYPSMILGTAIRIRDLRGGPGGTTIAKIAVAATPIGRAPFISRVRFYRPEPGTGVSENSEFHRGHWYVVIARHRATGGFGFDGACGRTRAASHRYVRRLARFAESR